VRIEALVDALGDGERRRLLALRGAYEIGADADAVKLRLLRQIACEPARFLEDARHDHTLLAALWPAVGQGAYPGRTGALLGVARALGRPMPEIEYALPEHALESLLERARQARGRRLRLAGARGHKGRVGDAVERLLVGGKVAGKLADHPAAEIKSVPVAGERVIERVKLGVVSATSNPLAKCTRVLFVFVEQRGEDHFVRGHSLREFDATDWQAMWRDGHLVETAAGSPRFPTRGLYLTPKWFRTRGLWPNTAAVG
jgi:hypothetical protein